MIKACIFDFDGVILNSERFHLLAWREAVRPFSLGLQEQAYSSLAGAERGAVISYLEAVRKSPFTEAEREEIIGRKAQSYAEFAETFTEKNLVCGVREFLERLKAAGIVCAVGSSGSCAQTLISKLGLGGYFKAVVGSEGGPPKPQPDIFLCAVGQLGVSPAEAVVFEDSSVGLLAAQRAGIKAVCIGEKKEGAADRKSVV